MKPIIESVRIQEIEKSWGTSLKELFRQWHWQDNLKHAEIAKRLEIPRPTVTRWFKQFKVPTQPATRFTNFNLLNTGPKKSVPAKPKIFKERKWKINERYFQNWSPDMAYILGFFCADGSMYTNQRGSKYITFKITDQDLLIKIKKRLGTGHKISFRRAVNHNWKDSWTLQMGSKTYYNRFLELGITPRKAHRLRIPRVPLVYMRDFIRGYFDGDGGVWSGYTHKNDRKTPTRIIMVTFTSSSKGMLSDAASFLHKLAGVTYKGVKFREKAFRLQYGITDSGKIYKFMYNNLDSDLYLSRKKSVFENYMQPSLNWLEHSPVTREVTGSSPAGCVFGRQAKNPDYISQSLLKSDWGSRRRSPIHVRSPTHQFSYLS